MKRSKLADRAILTLPYGIWVTRSGREVLFNRCYQPIWQRVGRVVSPADPKEWVEDIVSRKWFWQDPSFPYYGKTKADKQGLAIALEVLSDWGISWSKGRAWQS